MSFAHRASDIFDDRRAQEKIDQVGIELSASAVRDDPDGRLERARVTVWPRLSDRIERVGNSDDARFDRDRVSQELARIASAIPSLVVRQNPLGQIRIERSKRLENFRAFAWMRHHGIALVPCKPLRVVHDVRDRAIDFAYVVEERDPLDAALFALIEIGCASERQRVVGDTPDMRAGLGVVGVDGVQETFERRGSESLEGEPFTPLAVEENTCSRTHEERGESQEIVGNIDGSHWFMTLRQEAYVERGLNCRNAQHRENHH